VFLPLVYKYVVDAMGIEANYVSIPIIWILVRVVINLFIICIYFTLVICNYRLTAFAI